MLLERWNLATGQVELKVGCSKSYMISMLCLCWVVVSCCGCYVSEGYEKTCSFCKYQYQGAHQNCIWNFETAFITVKVCLLFSINHECSARVGLLVSFKLEWLCDWMKPISSLKQLWLKWWQRSLQTIYSKSSHKSTMWSTEMKSPPHSSSC